MGVELIGLLQKEKLQFVGFTFSSPFGSSASFLAMTSLVFFLQSLLRLADPRQFSVLSKFTASFRSSSSHLFYGFPERLAHTVTYISPSDFTIVKSGVGLLKIHHHRHVGTQSRNREVRQLGRYKTWCLRSCPYIWKNVRRVLGTSVIKDTLINKETVKANQSLSFIKHSSIRTNLTFIGPCIAIYFYSKTNQMHQCLKFILLE